mgnify:CR=1 FL=1
MSNEFKKNFFHENVVRKEELYIILFIFLFFFTQILNKIWFFTYNKVSNDKNSISLECRELKDKKFLFSEMNSRLSLLPNFRIEELMMSISSIRKGWIYSFSGMILKHFLLRPRFIPHLISYGLFLLGWSLTLLISQMKQTDIAKPKRE